MAKGRFSNFITKEFKHIFRDTRTLLIVLVMPVLQLLIFGFVISSEIKNANYAVLDYTNDYNSKKLVQRISSSGYFNFKGYLKNENEINEVFKNGDAKLVLIIGNNFTQKLQNENFANYQVVTDASDPNTASILASYAQGIVNSFTAEYFGSSQQKERVNVQSRMLYNEEMNSAFMFVPGTMVLILMLVTAMMTSISITREKEMGTMEILLVSPLKPWQIVVGKVIPYIGIAFTNVLVIILMGYTVFHLPLRGNFLLLMGVSSLFIVLALSLGILISTLSNSQAVAMFMSMFALMLPTILLSGFIFPIENMPKILQWLSLIMPPRWFLSALKTIMIKGQGLQYVISEVLVMLTMTTVFIALSIKKFKVRLE
ncbi:MAG TPA: ABC transporter permease [Tenuifilum sp.]|uniref:ABC transporter permease n=1 Tax=Tenuifilum sp. TaxID=2760880 RepID=UPI002C627C79|nr:ABC transporter permease [Tenuifilum sp.]